MTIVGAARVHRRARRLALGLILAGLAQGCGGGGDDGSAPIAPTVTPPPTAGATATTAVSTPTPTASPVATASPTHTASPAPSPQPTASPTPVDCWLPASECTLAETAAQVGIRVGAAIADPGMAAEQAVVPRHFNSITAENAMKWGSLAATVGHYDFTLADAIADFAARTGVRLRGHTLLWRAQQPADLAEQIAAAADPEQRMRELVTEHFQAVVTRYRGRVAMWDVVNEPLTTLGAEIDENIFYRTLGPGYIAEAFRLAHELDPDAALCLNEFLMTYSDTDPRTLALLELVRGLLADGVPLHAVGLEAHFHGLNLPPQRAPLERVVRLFANLGVTVELTELDISIRYFDIDADPLARQADAFRDVTAACMAVPGCTAITVWGIDDGRTWLDYFPPFDILAPHAPLLFDATLAPKPAYFAIRDAVAARPQP